MVEITMSLIQRNHQHKDKLYSTSNVMAVHIATNTFLCITFLLTINADWVPGRDFISFKTSLSAYRLRQKELCASMPTDLNQLADVLAYAHLFIIFIIMISSPTPTFIKNTSIRWKKICIKNKRPVQLGQTKLNLNHVYALRPCMMQVA